MPKCSICLQRINKNDTKSHLKKCYLEDTLGINIWHGEGLEYLKNLDINIKVNLILTDPPYIISHSTGMDKLYTKIEDGDSLKTEEVWLKFSEKLESWTEIQHKNYLKYGSIYGKKYAVRTDYGTWDSNFTTEILDEFIKLYYEKIIDNLLNLT